MSTYMTRQSLLPRQAVGLVVAAVCVAACTHHEPEPAAASSAPADGLALAEAMRRFLTVETVAGTPAGLDAPMPGRIAFQPQSVAGVGTPVAGRVVALRVRPGEAVAAGAVLVVLQSAEAAAGRAALAAASAAATAADAALRRQDAMMAQGVGVEAERADARARAQEARAELERARRAAALVGAGAGDRLELRAPAPGVVVAVDARVGAMVEPGAGPLVELGDPARLWAVADVAEGQALGLAVGQRAEITVPGAAARIAAVVDGIGPRVDPESRRLPVYLTFRGAPRALRPGMLAEVRVATQGGKALLLPATAVLIKEGDRRIVYVERRDGRFEPREVRTGAFRDGRVAINGGLAPGERVVVRGALLLDGEAEQLL